MRNPATSLFRSPSLRPYLVAIVLLCGFGLLDGGHGRFLNWGTAQSVLQQFATIGPPALAIGLTIILREFDLSAGSMMGLAGCIAVLAGGQHPLLGLAAAVAAGALSGLVQGFIMTRLSLSSVAVTLGGLLTLAGLAYVMTGNATLSYPNLGVAMLVDAPFLGPLSVRGAVAIVMFGLAIFIMAFTRTGRDVVAVGSDRRAAEIAGVPVNAIIAGTFAVSGILTAVGGALLSYSMAAASPAAFANTLIPAVTAAIIGGVSLSGGKGTPAGIAGGVLVLCILRASMSSTGLPPYVQDVVTGAVLLLVALADSQELSRRLIYFARWTGSPASPAKSSEGPK